MFTSGVTEEKGNDGRKNITFTAQERTFSIKNFSGKCKLFHRAKSIEKILRKYKYLHKRPREAF